MAWLLVLALGTAHCAVAQDARSGLPEQPRPVTTADPAIPVEHLKLLVKPLTREELVVEADGWRDLLKANVQRIAEARIGASEGQNAPDESQNAVDSRSKTEGDAGTSAEEAAAQPTTSTLVTLQQEKSQLVQRLNVVLDELEAKGGDAEVYRQYVKALAGIGVEVTDASVFWQVVQGWLVSDEGGKRWLWNIVKFLVIVIAFYFGASIVAAMVRQAATRIKSTSQLLVDFLGKFVKQSLMVIGLIVALAALEVNITPLLAAVGGAAFVIGLALQGTLSNFASGLLMMAYRPFDVGDVIEAAGISGIVDSMSLFSTHIRTFDNKLMVVPNNAIWGGTITNATASDKRRVDLTFSIGYHDDIAKAKNILETLLKEHELVFDEPAPVVQLNALGDSSVNFICRPWTKTGDYWAVYWDITRAVKEEFDRNGISIPYPQRDIHVYQESSASRQQPDATDPA